MGLRMGAFRLSGSSKRPAAPRAALAGNVVRARVAEGMNRPVEETFKFHPLAGGALKVSPAPMGSEGMVVGAKQKRRRLKAGERHAPQVKAFPESMPRYSPPAERIKATRVATELRYYAAPAETDVRTNGHSANGHPAPASTNGPPAGGLRAGRPARSQVVSELDRKAGPEPQKAPPAERPARDSEPSWSKPNWAAEIADLDTPARPGNRPDLGWTDRDDDDSDMDNDERSHAAKVLVLDRLGKFSADVAKAIAEVEPSPEVMRLNRPTQIVEVVDQESPDLIVVAPEEITAIGLKRLAEVHRADPKVVIVLSDSGKPITAAQTSACGASELLPPHPTKARLKSTLIRALGTAEELRQEHLVVTERVVVQEVPTAQVMAPKRPAHKEVGLARVFTVASASGGCGKTFFSTNLAAYLAKATRGKVLLIDLDLQFGEVAISLHLKPQRTIAELVEEEDIGLVLKDYIVSHKSGFKVLCAPKDPVSGDRVGPRETTMVIEAARKEYDYIVVDTPPSLNETCLAAFDQSQSLILMATMDLPSLKNLRIFLQTLEKLNLPADQVSLIVNKAESGSGINLKEVEPLYPQGFAAVLPYARQVTWSLNMGVPVLEADPNSEISRKLAIAGVRLVPASAGITLPWAVNGAEPRRGWFMRLLKGKAE
jgi:MinD-like ATPase involved in chromosome partitioning or flagellar assembly